MLGEISLYRDEPCTATAVTDTECEVLHLAPESFDGLCRTDPAVAALLHAFVARTLAGRVGSRRHRAIRALARLTERQTAISAVSTATRRRSLQRNPDRVGLHQQADHRQESGFRPAGLIGNRPIHRPLPSAAERGDLEDLPSMPVRGRHPRAEASAGAEASALRPRRGWRGRVPPRRSPGPPPAGDGCRSNLSAAKFALRCSGVSPRCLRRCRSRATRAGLPTRRRAPSRSAKKSTTRRGCRPATTAASDSPRTRITNNPKRSGRCDSSRGTVAC